MNANPFVAVIYHWIGGLASASCYIPFKGIKHWSFEIYWLIQGVFSWIIAPTLIATMLVPGVHDILSHTSWHVLGVTYFWGMLWGLGGLTFGLTVRYLGLALGYSIALGLCTIFGTLMPPLFSGSLPKIAQVTSGQVILLGLLVCAGGIFVSGYAGVRKERELGEEEKKKTIADFNFPKGVMVAIFSGVMSSCFAYGLASGKPIAEIARQRLLLAGKADLWQNLPVLIVVVLGGFTTNFLWCAFLILKNRVAGQFIEAKTPTLKEPVPLFLNYVLAAIAGVTWYFQFFFYSMGQTRMGKYDFSSWTLHMASIIIFSTLWGVSFKEWRGTSRPTKFLVGLGVATLVFATIIVGYGNYLQAMSNS